MKRTSTYILFLLLCSFIGGFIPNITNAQNPAETKFGVYWEADSNPRQWSRQLESYRDLGLTYIEIPVTSPVSLADTISQFPFVTLIRFDEQYLTTSIVVQQKEDLLDRYIAGIQKFEQIPNIGAFGLYEYSSSFSDTFNTAFNDLENTLRDYTDVDFYEIGARSQPGLSFSIAVINSDSLPSATTYLFNKEYDHSDLQLLTELITQSPSLIFFDHKWLQDALTDHAELAHAIKGYQHSGEFILPLKKSEQTTPGFQWVIFIYLVILLSFGIHIRFVPTYKPLIFRYFSFHRFFVDDVMRYRERSAISGVFLLIHHALFAGIGLYLIGHTFISPIGLESFYYHLPALAVTGHNYFSLFVLGFALAILIEFLGIFWLYLPNKAMKHFSQVLTLYTWIFHLDFILISLMLLSHLTNGSSVFILSMGIIFILVWLTGFFLTALDSSKYLMKGRVKYMILTFGLHTLLNILLLILFLRSDYIMQILELAVKL